MLLLLYRERDETLLWSAILDLKVKSVSFLNQLDFESLEIKLFLTCLGVLINGNIA